MLLTNHGLYFVREAECIEARNMVSESSDTSTDTGGGGGGRGRGSFTVLGEKSVFEYLALPCVIKMFLC